MTIIVEGQAQQPPVWPSTQGPNKLNIIWSPAALALARLTRIGPWTRTSWPGVCAFTCGHSLPANTARPKSWSRPSSSRIWVQPHGPLRHCAGWR